jgi:hypothetical protein
MNTVMTKACPPPIDKAVVFIVGSPRSGTTILGEMLGRHQCICQWYEPYFIWDHHFRHWPHDERSAEDARPAVVAQIRRDFRRYRNRSGASLIVDKSPRNSLKIPFIKAIFPQARFIHLIRDGRDATLSIHREWQRRRQIVNDPARHRRFNYGRAFGVLQDWLGRQPLWQDRLRSLWFETHGHLVDKRKHLNRKRWQGAVGWGPRFRGWERQYDDNRLLRFNALQWLKCVEAVRDAWDSIPPSRRLDVRYEDMLRDGRRIVSEIIAFTGLDASGSFLDGLPEMNKNNFNKWQREFTPDQLTMVRSVLDPMLGRLGYDIAYPG